VALDLDQIKIFLIGNCVKIWETVSTPYTVVSTWYCSRSVEQEPISVYLANHLPSLTWRASRC